ncbi:hypothetical protein ACLBWH_15445 [Sphingomonas sp. M6A6_1c]
MSFHANAPTNHGISHLTAADVARVLTGAKLLDRLSDFFLAQSRAPLRQRLDWTGGAELLVMPVISDDYAGIKMLTVNPGNAGTERPVISGLFTLADFRTGEVLATMDAGELTGWRTAAVSALAAAKLARQDASHLAILGAGHLCTYIAAAHAEARQLKRITLWARDAAKAHLAARRLRDRLADIDIDVCCDLQLAVQAADIVVAATRATEPLIRGRWLRPGMHIDLIGGYRPDMRELDDEGIASGPIYVDDDQAALHEAGDLIHPLRTGAITLASIRGDLANLASLTTGRCTKSEITIFKSVGTARADLATAITVWQRRRAEVFSLRDNAIGART